MFKQLKLRLVLVNVCIIAGLFLVLTTGTFFFLQNRMDHERQHIFNMVASDLLAGSFDDEFPGPRPRPRPPEDDPGHGPGLIFFAKLNMLGNVIKVPSFTPLPQEFIIMLAGKAYETGDSNGTINYHGHDYVFKVIDIPNNQGHYIIFQDLTNGRGLMWMLVSSLGAVGIVCLILSLFASLFMANKAMVPVRKAWQQQTDFLADASHELRTPLAVIQTNMEVVRDNMDETVASQIQWLDNIDAETASMSKLVNSLLFLARADSRQLLVEHETFALEEAIRAAAEPFRPVADRQGVQLLLQLETDCNYLGDGSKLRQVISILLDNALRYTPSGGTITVRLVRGTQGMILTVADTGSGISADKLPYVFQRFYQADASRAHGGAGLGLSIAKWIVEKHHGRITVDSTEGQGTEFKIVLPLQGQMV